MIDAAHNERVKLTATYLNSFATGLLVTGGIEHAAFTCVHMRSHAFTHPAPAYCFQSIFTRSDDSI